MRGSGWADLDRRRPPTTTSGRASRTRRIRPIGLLVAVLVLAGVTVPLGTPSAGADAAPATFDWSMPERFGPDRNGDGLIDYVEGATDQGTTGYDPTPASWRVDLDACASGSGADVTYAWRIVDQPDPANPIEVQGGPGCDEWFMEVPEEGAYRVDLSVSDGGAARPTVRKEVVVQDWLIISMGDSYGSGEGSPDVPIDQSALVAADAAWAQVEAAWEELWTIQADLEPLNAAIADYHAALVALAACADLADCAVKTAQVTGAIAVVVFHAVAYFGESAIETIGDAIALAGEAIENAQAIVDGATQLADSITGALSATWQDDQCHRSAKAGSALAAKQIEDEDPRTSVTFVHLACSGATMAYGLLGYYEGTEPAVDPNNPDETLTNEKCDADDKPGGWVRPAGCITPQVEAAKALAGGREVDAAYVSIGGNDAHFADIIISCILLEPCQEEQFLSNPGAAAADAFCPGLGLLSFISSAIERTCDNLLRPIDFFDTAAQLIEEGINGDVRAPIDKRFPGLSVGYGRLNTALMGTPEAAGLLRSGDSDRVFLSEYVDAIKDDDGTLCDFGTMGFASIPGLSTLESSFIDTDIVPALTGAIEAATVAHQWTFVDGVYDGFTNHGYCADDHYLVRMTETFQLEGRYQGMVHPNYAGHRVYRDAIYAKLRSSLYPAGAVTAPRRPDQAAFADAGGPWTVTEGSDVTLTNESWDSDGDLIGYAWSHDRPGTATLTGATSATPTLHGVDDAAGDVSVTVTDEDGSRTDTAPFTVTNAAPVAGDVVGLLDPILMGGTATATVPFGDAGAADTHTVSIDWGDGTAPTTATVTESGGIGSGVASHAYAATGIYTVTATVTDDDGASATTSQFAIVFDPAGGFVTGGGWFESPSGAYTPDDATDPDLVGNAHFGFVSKYQKGASVPEGNTSFRFQAADLRFESTAYDWMVVSGTKVTYKGLGDVNGTGGYAFMISAVDEGADGDRLRVKIWHKVTGAVLYDNQSGEAIDAQARLVIDAGQITVKGPK